MDCSTNNGGLWLGGRSGLCRSRSRLRLWQGIHPTASRDGHSRPTNCTAIALAERLCRRPDWLDQAGGTRSRRRAWRASPSARTASLHGISQRGPHASVAEQRRADSTRSSRRRSDLRKASSWWSASPIRSDLIYDRHSHFFQVQHAESRSIEPTHPVADTLGVVDDEQNRSGAFDSPDLLKPPAQPPLLH